MWFDPMLPCLPSAFHRSIFALALFSLSVCLVGMVGDYSDLYVHLAPRPSREPTLSPAPKRACAFVRAYLGLGPFRWNLPQSFLLFRPYQAGTHNTKSDHRTTREAPVTPTILTGLVTDGCRPAYQGAVRRTTVAWGGCAACVARASRRPARGPPRRPPGAPSAASALGASA